MSSALAPGEWWIGLDGWVLQDGNYSDVVAGQVRRFALEFWYVERLRRVPPGPVGCRWTGRGTTYAVTGEVLRAAPEPMDDAFVLDVGLPVYDNWVVADDGRPPAVGEHLRGEIGLAVDHFAYMDELAQQPGMPALVHTWTVLEVQLDTTPGMRVEPGHPLHGAPAGEGPMWVRDPDRESHRTIDRTRMWTDGGDDGGGGGGYRLRCRRHDVPPTRTISEAERHPPAPEAPRR